MPVSPLAERLYDLPDEAATDALAARFAQAFARWHATAPLDAASGLQVHLSGDLGAGKTAFVRAVLRALGHGGRVRSPTYTLVEPYRFAAPQHDSANAPTAPRWTRPLSVHHFDLYRFSDPAEWREAGFDEYLGAGALSLIEWPERAEAVLGMPDLWLTLTVMGEGRQLLARAFTDAGSLCLNDIA